LYAGVPAVCGSGGATAVRLASLYGGGCGFDGQGDVGPPSTAVAGR